MSRSRPIAVRLLALAFLALALLASYSSTAEALICLPDAPGEEVLSSQLIESFSLSAISAEQPVRAREARRDRLPMRCDVFGNLNCEWGVPEGEPSSPSPHQAKRTIAALVPAEAPLLPPAPTTLRLELTAAENSSDYLDDIFRPPRRS